MPLQICVLKALFDFFQRGESVCSAKSTNTCLNEMAHCIRFVCAVQQQGGIGFREQKTGL